MIDEESEMWKGLMSSGDEKTMDEKETVILDEETKVKHGWGYDIGLLKADNMLANEHEGKIVRVVISVRESDEES